MQEQLFEEYIDYSKKRVLIPLSGGINSMAVLCWLAKYPDNLKPKDLHLYYAHFEEHSPDTLQFVLDGVEYAKKYFENVTYVQTNNSVIDFFREQKMIPHPIYAPCTRVLKITPLIEYSVNNKIDVDLVGYVKEEKRRIDRMHSKDENSKEKKHFPISSKDNQWCFDIVKKEIGWYPKIYDIKENGKRIFAHNNCLPCKNMNKKNFAMVKKYYPEMWESAVKLSEELQYHWGRSESDYVDIVQTTFGRDDWETGYNDQPCETCSFD